MKLNGWQRMWVIVSGVWVVLWVAFGLAILLSGDEEGLLVLLASLATAVVPPVLLYAAGLGVAWIRSGFRG